MIIGIPLMQMLLFGYAINFDVRGIRAAVVDEANTSYSRALVAELGATGVVRFLASSPGVDELRRRLNAGEISVGVYIPADFERRRLQNDRAAAQLLVDGSEPMIDSVARGLATVPLPQRRGADRAAFEPVRDPHRVQPRAAHGGADRARADRRHPEHDHGDLYRRGHRPRARAR